MKKYIVMGSLLSVIGLALPAAHAGGQNLPDFRVKSIKLSPRTFFRGESVNVEVKVENAGKASGNAGWLELCSGGSCFYAYVGHLNARKSKTIRFSNVPTEPHTCNTKIDAYADAYNETHESRENNNRRSKTFKCRG